MSVESDVQPSAAETVGHVALPGTGKHDPHATRWGDFLKATIKLESSDLIMKTGQQPKVRIRGELKPLNTEPVSAEEFWQIVQHILTEDQIKDLHKFGSVDFAYDYSEKNRFRVNLFMARGKISVAARNISSNILPFEGLHLPPIM
ncbi:MAG TPA: hypothetical protein ENJ00_09930, partial [Phycisphaerales bacterium]|nr:hypothetical protein [Phycisphaerales bacterium]